MSHAPFQALSVYPGEKRRRHCGSDRFGGTISTTLSACECVH